MCGSLLCNLDLRWPSLTDVWQQGVLLNERQFVEGTKRAYCAYLSIAVVDLSYMILIVYLCMVGRDGRSGN